MSIQGQIYILVFSLLLLILVLELLRRRKITEAMTLWWLFIIACVVFISLNQPFLLKVTSLIGAEAPVSVLILFSLTLVLVMLIYFSVKISILSDQIKNLSQYIALHRKEFDDQVRNSK